jgi:hypothetical protein
LYTIDVYLKPTLSQQVRFITNDGTSTGQGLAIATDGSINIYDFGNAVLAPAGTIVSGNWYHLRFVFNNTTVVSSFVNGIRQTTSGSVQNFAANTALRIGWGETGVSHSFNGLIGPVRIVSGDLGNPDFGGTSTSSGSLSNTPTPSNISSFGNAAATNFNPFTVDIDTQRGKQSGYATLNPLDNYGNTLSNGNLTAVDPNNGNWYSSFGNFSTSNGKYYFEITPLSLSATCAIGVYVGTNRSGFSGSYPFDANTYMIHQNGSIYHNSSSYSYQTSYSVGSTIGVAVDGVNKKVWIIVNGLYAPNDNPSAGVGGIQSVSGVGAMPSGDIYPVITLRSSTATANFGQKPFKFPPPAGFQPLTLANLPRPTIVRPDQYVGVTTYTGTGSSRNVNTGFKPDFVWIKQRSSTEYHRLYDTIRGATKQIYSNDTAGEETGTNDLTAFTSTGFSLGTGTGVNAVSPATYVAWTWKAGGNSNTFNIDDVGYATASAAGLTAGTITPTGASVNTKSGFSIINFSSQSSDGDYSVSHGLNNIPKFIIMKSRTRNGGPWWVYHSSATTAVDLYLQLSTTDEVKDNIDAGGGNIWGSGLPTSTTFGFSTGAGRAHTQNETVIAYCWAEIPGFSKFGSYVGTNTTDNAFVHLGFKPAFLMIKNITSGGSNLYHWCIYDNERSTYNPSGNLLWASSSVEENNTGLSPKDSPAGDGNIDFLSNGFKVRSSGSAMGGPDTYIYAAFAEAPTFNLYGAQSNAR